MNFLTLFCIFGAVQSEFHNLHYIYTALSKPISQPGLYQFSAMGILNDRPIDIYNSKDKVKMPMQKWMKDHCDNNYWEKGTQSRRSKEQWFDINVKILMERMHQNGSDVHILQWVHGCEAEKTAAGKMQFRKGFDQYGYDGEDFLSFDNTHMKWVAPVVQARTTKDKWDNVPILSQYTKGYLETDCVHWLEKFVGYQDKQLKTLSPPEVHIFSKKSAQPDLRTLVCLATGFYPKDVSVEILRDGVPLDESDGVTSTGVRPNGDPVETYQLRKTLEVTMSDPSKYSCRVMHRSLDNPIEEFWDGQCVNCESGSTVAVAVAIPVILVIIAAVVGGLLYKKKKQIDKASQNAQNQQNQLLQGVPGKAERRGSDDSGKGESPASTSTESMSLTADEEGKEQREAGDSVEVV